MHWFEQLASLYCEADTPLYHMVAYTDVEISLDINGKLKGVYGKRVTTVIPVTESSMVRTSLVVPHSLSDRLKYLAAGISEPHHSAYLEQLNEWADSDYSTPRLRAVRQYIQNGSLLNDVLYQYVDSDAFIRFTVDGVHLWEDNELISAHIRRMQENNSTEGFCCVTGNITTIARSHPKHILPNADTAKLISYENRNLAKGTMRSIFSIGRETSFKAHTVLKRILTECGTTIDKRTFAAWDEAGNAIKLPLTDASLTEAVTGKITVICLAAATKGRISVTFLRRVTPNEFIERFRKWNRLGISPRTVADIAFGRPFNNRFICTESVYSHTTERLLGCILDDTHIPRDIISAARKRSAQIADLLEQHKGGNL